MRTVSMVLFLLMGSAGVGLAHVYLWRRLVRRTGVRRLGRRVAAVLLALGALLVPLALVLAHLLSRDDVRNVTTAGFLWLGLVFYVVLFLGMADALRLASRSGGLVRRLRARRGATTPAAPDGLVVPEAAPLAVAEGVPSGATEPPDPALSLITPAAVARAIESGRRAFLARAVAGTALLGGTATTLLGVRSALGEIRTPEVPVRLPGLPPSLAGLRIALLTDLHVGPVLGRGFVQGVVETTNALRPDIVVITGDLVDAPVARIARDVAPLAELRARYGVYFSTGNHEYYSDVDGWLAHLPTLGVRVLLNEHVTIGEHGQGLTLAGIADHHARWFRDDHVPDVGRALEGRDPQAPVVLLAHQPVQVHDAASHKVGLQLSGHTHGGQIWPFGALVAAVAQPYIAGLHQHTVDTQIYVSRGTGFWGPPMRVMAPAEVALIVLV